LRCSIFSCSPNFLFTLKISRRFSPPIKVFKNTQRKKYLTVNRQSITDAIQRTSVNAFVCFVCQSMKMLLRWNRKIGKTHVARNVCLMMPHFKAFCIIICNVIWVTLSFRFWEEDQDKENNRRMLPSLEPALH
jgi:hypothetical protein